MIVGAVGVADAASVADHVVEPGDRLGHHHVSGDRQQRRRELRHQLAEMDVGGEHDMGRAHARVRRVDALAHAAGVDRERRRFLEDAHAGLFRLVGEAERVIERMDVKGVWIMQRAEIARIGQLLAHARGRPRFHLGADPAQPFGVPAHGVVIIGLGDVQPPRHRIDARHAGLFDRAAHVVDAVFRQRIKMLGVVEADALDHGVDVFMEPGQHEAGIAPGGGPGDASRLQHRHRPAALGDLARDRQPGKPRADDADIDVELEGQFAAVPACNPGRLVPAIDCAIAVAHRLTIAARMLDCRRFEIDHPIAD